MDEVIFQNKLWIYMCFCSFWFLKNWPDEILVMVTFLSRIVFYIFFSVFYWFYVFHKGNENTSDLGFLNTVLENKMWPSTFKTWQIQVTITSKIFLLILYLWLLFRKAFKYEKVNGPEYCWLRGSHLNAFSNLEPENARGLSLWTCIWAAICWLPGSWANKWVSLVCVCSHNSHGATWHPEVVWGCPRDSWSSEVSSVSLRWTVNLGHL